jgi:3D (Asp-Asp-Asp) domain-containing protein
MKIMQIIKDELLPLNKRQNLILLIIIACIFQFVLFYAPVLAASAVSAAKAQNNQADDMIISSDQIKKSKEMDWEASKLKPETAEATSTPSLKVIRTSTHVITAYNSEAGQTDDSPCITANGFNVCKHGVEDTIAANFLKFGTKVQIPELFGDRIFVVRDRMNKRHTDRVDVWMNGKKEALKFGKKVAVIQVVE